MSTRLIIATIVWILGAAGVISAQTVTASGQLLRVTAERTNLRDKAALDGAVVASLSKGDEVEIIDVAGAWYRVRVKTTGKEGYVHGLVVERTSSATGPANPPVSPSPVRVNPQPTPPPSTQGAPLVRADSVVDDRRFGVGLSGGGLAFGTTPSVRYWMNERLGAEVTASFYSNYGSSTTAISPSVLVRFGEPRGGGSATFHPYFGGGLTFWKYSSTYYRNYYSDRDYSYGKVGFGGFAGTEVVFDAIPKLAVSGNLGFYSSPSFLGYSGLFWTVGAHWYFK
jgi:hypothetical protein